MGYRRGSMKANDNTTKRDAPRTDRRVAADCVEGEINRHRSKEEPGVGKGGDGGGRAERMMMREEASA